MSIKDALDSLGMTEDEKDRALDEMWTWHMNQDAVRFHELKSELENTKEALQAALTFIQQYAGRAFQHGHIKTFKQFDSVARLVTQLSRRI